MLAADAASWFRRSPSHEASGALLLRWGQEGLAASRCRRGRGRMVGPSARRDARPELADEDGCRQDLKSRGGSERRERQVAGVAHALPWLAADAEQQADIEGADHEERRALLVAGRSLGQAVPREQPVGDAERELQEPADEEYVSVAGRQPSAPLAGDGPVDQHRSADDEPGE